VSIAVFGLLLLFTAAWFVLPLLPALRELYRPSDAEPLTMVGEDAGDLTVFAEGFRNYLRRQLPSGISLGLPDGQAIAQLSDGTPVVYLDGRPELLAGALNAQRLVSRLVVTEGPVLLPGGETFLLELYARSEFVGGPVAVYRALLGEADVQLGTASTVLRWVHAERNLVVGDESLLAGRASAGDTMRLGFGVRFNRLGASRIVIGEGDPPAPTVPAPLLASTTKLPRSAERVRGFVRVDDDLTIPPAEGLLGTVVITGSLTLGPRSRISGNVKVYGSCVLERGAVVDGSLVCRGDVCLEPETLVLGPLVAERNVWLGEACVVGAEGHPASVVASTIVCAPRVQVFGAITAREKGRTAAAGEPARTVGAKNAC
jgi:hypothetical protein